MQYKPSIKFSPGTVSSTLAVPQNIGRPPYAEKPRKIIPESKNIPILSIGDRQKMRIVSKIAREVLDEAVKSVKPGIFVASYASCN
jgi:hypothetical protein